MSQALFRTRSPRRFRPSRLLRIELLEHRQLLNVDWRNPADALDASADQKIDVADLLAIVTEVRANGFRRLPETRPEGAIYVDTDGDGVSSANDLLVCISVLRQGELTGALRSVQEGASVATETLVVITVGQPSGTRTYRLELDPTFDETTSPVPDRINIYVVDRQSPGVTLLDRGVPGTSVFSLTGSGVETVAGLSQWDGSVLELDLTRAAGGGDTALLVVQVLGGDTATGTRTTVKPLSNVVNPSATPAPFTPQASEEPGAAASLTGYQPTSMLQPQIANVRYGAGDGRYEADLRVSNVGGAVDRNVLVAVDGLPAGATLQNASGTTTDGRPYVNLAPAVAGASLEVGATTGPVRLQFDNPGGARFTFQLEALALTGSPLVIDTIPELTVHPGRRLEFPLTAAGGTAGAPLTFTVDITNLSHGLPTGKIKGQGKLIFEPTIAEVGTYTFDVLAHNGQQTARQTVTLNVTPDPETSTRLFGQVRDTQGNVLAGVPVKLGSRQTTTSDDGSFVLEDIPVDLMGVNLEVSGSVMGPAYRDIKQFVNTLMDPHEGLVQEIQVGERNDIIRPVYVPKIDIDQGVIINPDVETIVTNPNLPGVQLTIPVGGLRTLDRELFQGTIYLTEVATEFAEVPPDPSERTTSILRIDASDSVVFGSSAPLRLPNEYGFRPGEDNLELGPPRGNASLNPFQGVTAGDSGSPSGGFVETPPGEGVMGTGEHAIKQNFPFFIDKHDEAKNKDKIPECPCPPCGESCQVNSEIDLHSGSFREMHDLVSYQSQGVSRGIRLTYNSEWADPRPIVHLSTISLFLPQPQVIAADPSTVRFLATLETRVANAFGGAFTIQAPGADGGTQNLHGGENAWRYTDDQLLNSHGAVFALQLDLRGLPSGIYPRDSAASVVHQGESGWIGLTEDLEFLKPSDNTLVHINEIHSPFGAGWSMQGLQKIVSTPEGAVILIDGGGGEWVFQRSTETTYASPPGDFTFLEKLGDGSYRRTWPNQSVDLFDPAGRLVESTDRNGNATRYEYDAEGRLVKTTDPVGLETAFTYANGKLASITDPVGRMTQFEHDAAGNLTRITDPDGSTRQFGYNELHHLVTQIDQRSAVTTVQYGAGGRATGELMPAYTTPGATQPFVIHSLQEQGLEAFAMGATRDLANSPQAIADVNGEVTWTGLGREVTTQLDEFGRIAPGGFRRDGEGNLGDRIVSRNFDLLPTVIQDPHFELTHYSYTHDGQVLLIQDEIDFPLFDLGDGQGSLNHNRAVNPAGAHLEATGVASFATLPLTLEAWVSHGGANQEPLPTDNVISTSTEPYSDMPYGYGFGLQVGVDRILESDASLLTVITPGGGAREIRESQVPFSAGEWRHVATVYTAGEVKTYVDGQLVDVYLYTPGLEPAGDALVIGKQFFGNFGEQFIGSLDEVRVWNVARTEEDIQRDMHFALSGDEPGLVHYFPFNYTPPTRDDWQGTDVTDHGPGRANVTIVPVRINGQMRGVSRSPLAGVRYTHDSRFQQVTSIVDGNHHQTLMEIDPDTGDTLSITRVVGAIGGGDEVVTRFTYLASGLIDTVTDALGRVTDYGYDERERLIFVSYAQGLPEEGTWRYEYDNAGNVTAMVDPNNHRTEYEYDVMNRLTKVAQADPDGDGPLGPPVSTMSYNAAGDLLTVTDPQNNTVRYEYDARGAVRSMTAADGGVTQYVRNAAGNVVSITDPLGRIVDYVYDERQRVIETIDPDGGRTRFEYDLKDNLTALIDPNGYRTSYEYDMRNRLIQRTSPRNPDLPQAYSVTFAHDAANNLIERVDRNDRKTLFAYDDLDRPVSETWVDGGNTISFRYDAVGNLLTIGDAFSHLAMAYDGRDRLISIDNALTPSAPNVLLTYQYDAASNLQSTMAAVAGAPFLTNAYGFDALNRVNRVAQSGPGVSEKRVDLTYNSLGQFASLHRFRDLSGADLVAHTAFAYDERNRLTSLSHATAADEVLAFENLTYDLADRITRILTGDGQTDYAYDDRDQLTGADHSDPARPDETYAYDSNGNRVSSHRHGEGYETATNNQLASDGVYNYAYDNEGNLILRTEIATGAVRAFAWDFRNRLTAVIDKPSADGAETQRVEFTYDVFDRRIGKRVTTPTRSEEAHFVYDGADVLFDFMDADANGPAEPQLAQTYLHGPAIDQVLAQESEAGEVLWLLADHLGSITDLIDNTAVVNHIKYDSYGNIVSESDPAARTRYTFTGREHDRETGLMYYRARYYDSTVALFISEDPASFVDGANLYQYVGGDPVINRDPSGLKRLVFYDNTAGAGIKNQATAIPADAWVPIKEFKDIVNRLAQEREPVEIVILGHSDDGKSQLIDDKGISKEEFAKLKDKIKSLTLGGCWLGQNQKYLDDIKGAVGVQPTAYRDRVVPQTFTHPGEHYMSSKPGTLEGLIEPFERFKRNDWVSGQDGHVGPRPTFYIKK